MSSLVWRSVLLILFLSGHSLLKGDEPAGVDRTVPLSRARLPKPEDSIERLLDLGDVSFATGRRPVSDVQTDAVASQVRRQARRSLDAETSYRLRYHYRNRLRWTVKRVGGKRILSIAAHFSHAKLTPSHVVWLRNPPEADRFWEDKLVLHELDHVRISSDARLSGRFEQRLKESGPIEHPLDSGEVADSEFARRVVESHVRRVFDEISELVAIRYRELDRVTGHGVRAIPEGSTLRRWLQDESSTAQR